MVENPQEFDWEMGTVGRYREGARWIQELYKEKGDL